MKKLCVCFVVCALLAALLAGCTPAAQPPVGETGATTAATATATATATVTTQSTAVPTTDATDRTYPSRYTGRDDIKVCVTAVTQETCLPFTVVASELQMQWIQDRLPELSSEGSPARGVIIRSIEEWKAISPSNIPKDAAEYDEAFFEHGVLVLLASFCSHFGYQFRLTNAAVSGHTLTFEGGYITGVNPPTLSDWLVLIELKKEDVEGVDTLQVEYWESRWAYPDEDA